MADWQQQFGPGVPVDQSVELVSLPWRFSQWPIWNDGSQLLLEETRPLPQGQGAGFWLWGQGCWPPS